MRDATLSVLLLVLLTPLTAPQSTTLSQNPKAWWPTSGTVILFDGGIKSETADLFVDRLIALVGGPDALIVVIPTASDGLPAQLPTSGPQPPRINTLR